jgi:hypothetical protein
VDGGNRYDSTEFGTIYGATDLEGCFAETLARYRPSPAVLAALGRDAEWRRRGFMDPGSVPADWRHRRVIVHLELGREVRFLDVEATATHTVLTEELAEELADVGHGPLDVAGVRGPDRRITRAIAQWAYTALDQSGDPAFAGIRYLSRLGPYECWAIFDRTPVLEIGRHTITTGTRALRSVQDVFGIRVF